MEETICAFWVQDHLKWFNILEEVFLVELLHYGQNLNAIAS